MDNGNTESICLWHNLEQLPAPRYVIIICRVKLVPTASAYVKPSAHMADVASVVSVAPTNVPTN